MEGWLRENAPYHLNWAQLSQRILLTNHFFLSTSNRNVWKKGTSDDNQASKHGA